MTNAIRLTRRHALKLATAGAAAIALPTRAQSDWPTRPIKIIVPLQPGGVGDIYARSVAERLQVTLRQPVVIENKPGGLYTIGMQALAAAPADGYTFMQINAGMLAFQATQKKYEVEKLLPISEANAVPCVLFASAKAPFKTAQEMVAWGRANPGQINYCSLGPGSLEHLLGFVLTKAAGIEDTHIPYKGGPSASATASTRARSSSCRVCASRPRSTTPTFTRACPWASSCSPSTGSRRSSKAAPGSATSPGAAPLLPLAQRFMSAGDS